MKVSIIAAMTADGYIGRDAHHLADWSSKEDKKLFVKLTREAGVIVMGSRTYATIGRALPKRRNIMYTTRPEETAIEGVEATSENPADLIRRLTSEGETGLAICGGATIYSLFMEAGVVTDLYLTIEPVLFGEGIRLFASPLEKHLQLETCTKLNEHAILIHYSILKS